MSNENQWSQAMHAPEMQNKRVKPQRNWTRYERADWASGSLSTLSTPIRPVVAIALGPNDESGGVILKGGDFGSSQGQVSVGAPWVGLLTEPVQFLSLNPTSLPSNFAHRLDLILYHELCTELASKRAPLYRSGTLGASGGFGAWIFGRKRVSVYLINGAGAPQSASVALTMLTPGVGTSNIYAYSNAALGAGNNAVIELSNSNRPPTAAGTDAAASWLPTAAQWINITAGAGGSLDYVIQAWDD